MKTNNSLGTQIVRGTAVALLFSCARIALCSAINLTAQSPKAIAPRDNATLGAKAHQNRSLSFADRVADQRAIDDVYWRHRIWPKERPDPKPSLEAVMSQAQLEKKVIQYLRNSQALADDWQRPITADQLQAEMERIASHTKQPDVLREIFAALGNDPFIIAECLARPVLAQRLVSELNAQDKKPATVAWKEPLRSWLPNAEPQVRLKTAAVSSANYTLPVIASPSSGCTDDIWTPTTLINAPNSRSNHTAVWTGSEMIVWGGQDATQQFNSGGRYDPTTDTWTSTSTTNAPSARHNLTSVWTGSEMIVWGGYVSVGGTVFNTGSRYNPGTDTWVATSTTNAPSPRYGNAALWTGSEMIVWGGSDFTHYFNTGGKYDPSTDTWTATSTTNAPAPGVYPTAVWIDSDGEMIVWGGYDGTKALNSGGRYNPGTDSWTATSKTNAPSARYLAGSVWTGSEMIVWGGLNSSFQAVNTGGRYDPSTDSWTATTTNNAPSARYWSTPVWTGREMIVWGGYDGCCQIFSTGGRYDPNSDSWTATSLTGAPAERWLHVGVWTGNQMIVWGGYNVTSGYLNTGGRYCAFAGLGVISSDPACGSVVSTQLNDFVINLSDPVRPATVQATDFSVNGTPANSFTLSNGNTTITFHYTSSPVITEGEQTMHIPPGAFRRDPDRDPVVEFDCTFRYDATLLAVTDTVPPVGGTFSPPAPRTYQFDVNWNEAVEPTSVQATDLALSGNTSATVTNVEVVNGNMTTRFTLDVLYGGSLTANIAAGAITDQFGNPNAEFSGSYTVKGPKQPCGPVPPNMVSWWPGDGNADDIIGTNNGTLHNGATFAPGLVDQAFSFDGNDDYVQATDTDLPFASAARTLDFWMNAAFNARVPVIYGNPQANDAFYILIANASACIGQWGGGDVCGSTDITDGNWHHVALTYDGDRSAVLYVDGALETTATRTYTTTQTGKLYIGGTVVSPQDYFTGLVDEVDIVDRALSQAEIQSIVDAGSLGKCKPTPITLSAVARKVGGINTVRLTWSGATSTDVDIYRDSVVIVTTPNDGSYIDSTGDTGRARYTYRVCETGTQTCSNEVTVKFRQ